MAFVGHVIPNWFVLVLQKMSDALAISGVPFLMIVRVGHVMASSFRLVNGLIFTVYTCGLLLFATCWNACIWHFMHTKQSKFLEATPAPSRLAISCGCRRASLPGPVLAHGFGHECSGKPGHVQYGSAAILPSDSWHWGCACILLAAREVSCIS